MSNEEPSREHVRRKKEHPYRVSQRKREKKVREKLGSLDQQTEITQADRDNFSRCSVRGVLWGTGAFLAAVVPQQFLFGGRHAPWMSRVIRASIFGSTGFIIGVGLSFPGCISYVMKTDTPLGQLWREREITREKWLIERVLPKKVVKIVYDPPDDL